MNLYALFLERFSAHFDRAFLVRPGRSDLTYAAMDALSARYAGVLSRNGVGIGDRVVVQVDKSAEAVGLYLACLRIGAIYVPLNVAYTPSEVAYFIDDTRPAVFVCSPSAQPHFKTRELAGLVVLTLGAAGEGSLADFGESGPARTALADMGGDDIAAILYTSGTTGRSKGAMLSLENLASNALTLHKLWEWEAEDVLLHALPIFHVHGLFVALHCAMLNASPVIFLERFDVDELRRHLARATVLMGVPTFYSRLLSAQGFCAAECAHMRVMISGSAPLTEQSFLEFEECTGHKILERYGMTETGMITSNPYHGERLAGTVGFPLPGVEVRVADDEGHLLPAQAVGNVEVRGPNIFRGYWEMPEKTAAEFRPDGFFITGDLGCLSEDGRLTLVGRGKDLIISGGYNIYPKEVELLLDESPQVKESAVIGVPHADLGEAVLAVVVPAPNAMPEEAMLLETLQGRLARFKQPRRIIVVPELPRNAMGKVQKNLLRDEYSRFMTTR